MEETDKLEDNEFLMDIMMAREEIEMAETAEETESAIQKNKGQYDAFIDNKRGFSRSFSNDGRNDIRDWIVGGTEKMARSQAGWHSIEVFRWYP